MSIPEKHRPLSQVKTVITTDTYVGDGSGLKGPRIRCPLCDWQPQPDDLWACACGHQWHTFDTGGVCPSCLHQWMSTQCHPCKGWSAHSNWYKY